MVSKYATFNYPKELFDDEAEAEKEPVGVCWLNANSVYRATKMEPPRDSVVVRVAYLAQMTCVPGFSRTDLIVRHLYCVEHIN